jgi:hypothetical protein
MRNLNLLEKELDGEHGVWLQALRSFHQLTRDCYGRRLTETWKDFLEKFKDAYLNLGISITRKVHVVFSHL